MTTGVIVAKRIAQISDDNREFVLAAVIIAKSDPRFFTGTVRSASNGSSDRTSLVARGVLTLTLRDSEKDTINCTIWAKADVITHYDNSFDVGDVVDVQKPQVSSAVSCRSEQYSPNVSSLYWLTINEQVPSSQIVHHEGKQLLELKLLLKVPSVRPEETIPLADIVASGTSCRGETFNVLVVVRAVRPSKEIRITRTNQMKSFREVVVMDQSHTGVVMKFWSESLIKKINAWVPLTTVLLIADVRIDFNEYYKTVGLTMDRKTIITQDPNVPQLQSLLRHAKNIPMQDVDIVCSLSSGTVDPATISTVMTVQQILDRTEGDLVSEVDQFTALCYAVITRLDLDGSSRIVSQRCVHCRTLLRSQEQACSKLDCTGHNTPALEQFFDLSVDLTDHTGTLQGCRMIGATAETVLQCDVKTFLGKTDTQKTELKWMYLLDRCAVRLVVKRRSAVRFQNLFSIVACALADPTEVEAKLKVY
ncbi:meiosis-specific with OB domain-containing protein [Anopheles ziemanni]|uniref:meiosis-specific with OB domain-containing protein n=1 Tax=Anopheles coustani TaxID=139045 RepID=UPI0026581BC4|nr:meiosis-specific with OB domain-containing protein [Anopheles coustani]XP_058173696.1 meiosis-specific with OB domain-containing protein [Anopheles ziemanni]